MESEEEGVLLEDSASESIVLLSVVGSPLVSAVDEAGTFRMSFCIPGVRVAVA